MSDPSAIPKPTTAELDLLQTLWPLGAATARQVHEAIQAERPDVTYATVLRLMQIMKASARTCTRRRRRKTPCRATCSRT
jgi:predicted transcriptional regulator